MIRRTFAVTFSAALALAGAACAQAGPGCDGQYAVVRVSKLKPGQGALFARATADQVAWYRGKGITTNSFKVGTMLDGAGAEQRLTLHLNAPAERPAPDAGWNAFVQEFRDSSDILTETRVCLKDVGK